MNAIFDPSGDHDRPVESPPAQHEPPSKTCLGFEPSASMIHTCGMIGCTGLWAYPGVWAATRYAICDPSGDHLGLPTQADPGFFSRTRPFVPSAFTS